MVHRYNKDTQQKILKEATDLFMSKGYLGTSTREIAQKVGITQPNLYHYFGDKEKTIYGSFRKPLKRCWKSFERNRSNKRNGISSNLDKNGAVFD